MESNSAFENILVHCLMTNKQKQVLRRGETVFVKAGNVPDSDRAMVEDEEGFRYKRVVAPRLGNFWVFKQI